MKIFILKLKWSENIVGDAKRSEKIEAKRREMKRKNWFFVFAWACENKVKRIPFRLISLRSEKIFYAKTAHPNLNPDPGGHRMRIRILYRIRNTDSKLAWHNMKENVMLSSLYSTSTSSSTFAYFTGRGTIFCYQCTFFGLFRLFLFCFGSIETPKLAVSILNRNNRNKHLV
jgi:hypothetical protein